MKTKLPLDPAAAFPNPAQPPVDADLPGSIGTEAAQTLFSVLTELRVTQPAIATAWQFSAHCGWYQLWVLKKRRLLYVVPKRRAVRASLILGGKAIAALQTGPHARKVTRLLKSAKRYPEGTSFSFEDADLDPQLLAALLEAKIAH